MEKKFIHHKSTLLGIVVEIVHNSSYSICTRTTLHKIASYYEQAWLIFIKDFIMFTYNMNISEYPFRDLGYACKFKKNQKPTCYFLFLVV